jgi:hypothetical protein
MIERNPRQGVELRVRHETTETLAALACYWLVAMFGLALATGHTAPLFVSLAIVFAGLYITRPRR